MGIEGFNRILDIVARKYRAVRSNTSPDDITSLLVDGNSFIYTALADVKKENDGASTLNATVMTNSIIEKLIERLDKLRKDLKPSEVFGVLFDGVAPDAKVNQQKRRRFMAAMEQGRLSASTNHVIDFDTTVISPGTTFMNAVVSEVKRYLGSLEVVQSVKNIIFSPDTAPGEGEHKIMALFRDGFIRKHGSHVIVGNDNDFIVLAAVQTMPNIFIYKNERDTFIDVNLFKYYMMEVMGTGLADIYNGDITIMYDFVALSAFLGNDFIPTPIACMRGTDPKYNVFNVLLEVYKKVTNNGKLRLVGPDARLNVDNILSFAIALSEKEPEMLQEVVAGRDSAIFVDNFEYVSRNYVAKDDTTQHMKFKTDYDTFVSQWQEQEYKVNPVTRTKKYTKEEANYTADEAGIAFVCGISWTLAYYIVGKANNEWVYRYVYAPMLFNVDFSPVYEEDEEGASSIRDDIEAARTPKAPLMTIPQVLYNILPSNIGKNVVPDNLRELISSNSIKYELTIDYYGLGDTSHIYTINLPFVTRPSGELGEKLKVIGNTERYKARPSLVSERNEANINVAMREKAEEEDKPKSKRVASPNTANGIASTVSEPASPNPSLSGRRTAIKKTTSAARPQKFGMIKQ